MANPSVVYVKGCIVRTSIFFFFNFHEFWLDGLRKWAVLAVVCGDDTPTLGDVLSCEVCGEFLHRGCLPPSAVAKTSSPRHVLCSECEPLTKLNWNNASTQQIRDFEIMAFDEPSDIGKFSMPKE
eukprot:1349506-Amorphochlora_amoeboformis.AAC.1